jgi:alpha-D-xyloside xylohydrolase
MRPLFFDFPKDPGCNTIDDQFLFGPDLLVAPILRQGTTRREIYLPAGAKWTDAWTGKEFKGSQTVTADAPLDKIPLYLRDGRKLPIVA